MGGMVPIWIFFWKLSFLCSELISPEGGNCISLFCSSLSCLISSLEISSSGFTFFLDSLDWIVFLLLCWGKYSSFLFWPSELPASAYIDYFLFLSIYCSRVRLSFWGLALLEWWLLELLLLCMEYFFSDVMLLDALDSFFWMLLGYFLVSVISCEMVMSLGVSRLDASLYLYLSCRVLLRTDS